MPNIILVKTFNQGKYKCLNFIINIISFFYLLFMHCIIFFLLAISSPMACLFVVVTYVFTLVCRAFFGFKTFLSLQCCFNGLGGFTFFLMHEFFIEQSSVHIVPSVIFFLERFELGDQLLIAFWQVHEENHHLYFIMDLYSYGIQFLSYRSKFVNVLLHDVSKVDL